MSRLSSTVGVMSLWLVALFIVALLNTAAVLCLLVGTAGCRADDEDDKRYEAASRNRERGGLDL